MKEPVTALKNTQRL